MNTFLMLSVLIWESTTQLCVDYNVRKILNYQVPTSDVCFCHLVSVHMFVRIISNLYKPPIDKENNGKKTYKN